MIHCAFSIEIRRRKLPICSLTAQKHNPMVGIPILDQHIGSIFSQPKATFYTAPKWLTWNETVHQMEMLVGCFDSHNMVAQKSDYLLK